MADDFFKSVFTPPFSDTETALSTIPLTVRPVDPAPTGPDIVITAPAAAGPAIPLDNSAPAFSYAPATIDLGSSDPAPTDPDIVVVGRRTMPDQRIRLSAVQGQETNVYGVNDPSANIMARLHATTGLLFPYTPSISMSQDTSWQAADLENTNYDILSYQKTSSATFGITGKFTVQNQREGEYMLAAIHFFRTVSKAYFGSQDVEQFMAPTKTNAADPIASTDSQVSKTRTLGKAGLPPPVLCFSGYGDMMFNEINVVVKSHSWSFDENSDMVRVKLPINFSSGSTFVWLPPVLTIQCSLAMQQNTNKLRDNFKLDDFRTGELLTKRGWF